MSGVLLLILRAGMAILLYSFLGWALLLLVRDLRYESQKVRARQFARMTLIRDTEPDSQKYQFNQLEIIVGRDPMCDLVINDTTVSSQHARLSYHHTQWWVEDLGSKNGTLLNEVPVTSAVVLTDDDRIRCGSVTLQVIPGEE